MVQRGDGLGLLETARELERSVRESAIHVGMYIGYCSKESQNIANVHAVGFQYCCQKTLFAETSQPLNCHPVAGSKPHRHHIDSFLMY